MTSQGEEKIHIAVGVMSGTSLDGIDVVVCRFFRTVDIWKYEIVNAITYEYDSFWVARLKNLYNASATELAKAHAEYGQLLAARIMDTIRHSCVKPDLIATHGHTIFHQPNSGYTYQLGSGAVVAARTGIPVVCDFRSTDVANGGQGAPLVPIGDKLLFSEYESCLNLGGFSNISFDNKGQRIAFDICPVNIVLNMLSRKLGHSFDPNGMYAGSGKVIPDLLQILNDLPFYNQHPPKSLGWEWVERNIISLIDTSEYSTVDLLRTFTEHIAINITKVVNDYRLNTVLVTGGGAYNQLLINRMVSMSESRFVIPANSVIDFKEALIFAFLGTLRKLGQVNCLASVTGARSDSCCGAVYMPATLLYP